MTQKACVSSFWKTGSVSERLCGEKNEKSTVKQPQTHQHKQSRIKKGISQVTIYVGSQF